MAAPTMDPKIADESAIAAEVADLHIGVLRLEVESQAARASLSELQAALDIAVAEGDDDSADRVERRLKVAKRTITRCRINADKLAELAEDREAARVEAAITRHRQLLVQHFDAVKAQLAVLVDVNEAACAAYAAAREAIGDRRAAAWLQPVHYSKLNTGSVGFWATKVAEGLSLTPQPAARADVKTVKILRSFKCFVLGDRASFTPDEAAKLVDSGAAAYETEQDKAEAADLWAADPHNASPPAANTDGTHLILFVAYLPPGYAERQGLAAYQPGDLAAFPADEAVTFVRRRIAIFAPSEAAP